MSGDVQPRKRKDKKRKKDELGVEEPRGTAAALGEGDVFMHSQHEHGTGGHWCAKIIFFSLLAVLVTLIGLIILENRGLTDLEANSVESRYSGVLEGWLEDPADDDHHDEHTLELLKQHDDDEDDHDEHEISHEDDHDEVDHDKENDDESGHDDEENDESGHDDEENDESGHDDDDDDESGHDDDDDNESGQDDDDENEVDGQEASNEAEDQEDADEDDDDDDDDQEDDKHQSEEAEENNDEEDDNDSGEEKDDDDDDLQNVDEDSAEDNDVRNDQADDQSAENDDDQDDDNSQEDEENDNDDEEHEEHEEEEGDSEIEVEKLEQEVSDDDAASEEQPSHEDDDDDKSQEDEPQEDDGDSAVDEADDGDSVEDEEFLEADDLAEPPRIVAPKGRPLVEVEDEPTTAKPVDTLAEEEEYEKQQEELRKEQEQASHVWLKLSVGGALLVATYAVVSRAAAPRDEDDTPASEGHASREDTPSSIDRRMTLISEESAAAAPAEDEEEIVTPVIEEKVFETISPVFKAAPVLAKEESEEEDIEEEEELIIDTKDVTAEETQDKELYSDEEEPEEVEEEEEEELVVEKKEAPKQAVPVTKKAVEPEPEPEPEPEEEEAEEDDVGDDVEIIDDEQLEEELEEEGDDEEEISDVDDAELLNRLEAKYGRLPEPERPGQKQKDGGNSIEDQWPGEPSDKYWRQQLDEAEQQLRQGDWSAASERVSDERFKDSARARWIRAQATDAAAEARRDNGLLTRAITDYLNVLKLHDRLSDKRLREVADRTLDRIQFRGNYVSAEPVYRLLIRRFPDDVVYRNNLTVSLLMANRADLAEEVIKETLKKWPDDRVSLANLGFILKTKHNRLEEAVEAFQKALEGDVGPATDSRFYYHLGDALLLLRRFDDAHEVHKRGAKLGHFLSPVQRSLYNVDRLKSQPWWNIEQTPYTRLAQTLEKSWKEILKEGQGLQELYDKEKEGLKEKGEWSQLDLFVRGQEVPGRCKKAPVTCSVVRSEAAAVGCKRGQIKFSLIEAGTHVRPHVGPTNCRLRMHLGLSNTKDTYIRVDKETRQWQVGKVFMFDDSFEHEVWHNGTGARLVLIVDVWHPDLTPNERRRLPPI